MGKGKRRVTEGTREGTREGENERRGEERWGEIEEWRGGREEGGKRVKSRRHIDFIKRFALRL